MCAATMWVTVLKNSQFNISFNSSMLLIRRLLLSPMHNHDRGSMFQQHLLSLPNSAVDGRCSKWTSIPIITQFWQISTSHRIINRADRDTIGKPLIGLSFATFYGGNSIVMTSVLMCLLQHKNWTSRSTPSPIPFKRPFLPVCPSNVLPIFPSLGGQRQ